MCKWNFNDNIKFIRLNESELDKSGLQHLQNCLSEPHLKCCQTCNIILDIKEKNISNIIYFYVEPFEDPQKTISLQNIPQTLTVESNNYSLYSFVNLNPGLIEESNHYVSYCLRNNI